MYGLFFYIFLKSARPFEGITEDLTGNFLHPILVTYGVLCRLCKWYYLDIFIFTHLEGRATPHIKLAHTPILIRTTPLPKREILHGVPANLVYFHHAKL